MSDVENAIRDLVDEVLEESSPDMAVEALEDRVQALEDTSMDAMSAEELLTFKAFRDAVRAIVQEVLDEAHQNDHGQLEGSGAGVVENDSQESGTVPSGEGSGEEKRNA